MWGPSRVGVGENRMGGAPARAATGRHAGMQHQDPPSVPRPQAGSGLYSPPIPRHQSHL